MLLDFVPLFNGINSVLFLGEASWFADDVDANIDVGCDVLGLAAATVARINASALIMFVRVPPSLASLCPATALLRALWVANGICVWRWADCGDHAVASLSAPDAFGVTSLSMLVLSFASLPHSSDSVADSAARRCSGVVMPNRCKPSFANISDNAGVGCAGYRALAVRSAERRLVVSVGC